MNRITSRVTAATFDGRPVEGIQSFTLTVRGIDHARPDWRITYPRHPKTERRVVHDVLGLGHQEEVEYSIDEFHRRIVVRGWYGTDRKAAAAEIEPLLLYAKTCRTLQDIERMLTEGKRRHADLHPEA